jgi:hypothetical protein
MTPVPTRTVLTAAIAAGIILTTGPTSVPAPVPVAYTTPITSITSVGPVPADAGDCVDGGGLACLGRLLSLFGHSGGSSSGGFSSGGNGAPTASGLSVSHSTGGGDSGPNVLQQYVLDPLRALFNGGNYASADSTSVATNTTSGSSGGNHVAVANTAGTATNTDVGTRNVQNAYGGGGIATNEVGTGSHNTQHATATTGGEVHNQISGSNNTESATASGGGFVINSVSGISANTTGTGNQVTGSAVGASSTAWSFVNGDNNRTSSSSTGLLANTQTGTNGSNNVVSALASGANSTAGSSAGATTVASPGSIGQYSKSPVSGNHVSATATGTGVAAAEALSNNNRVTAQGLNGGTARANAGATPDGRSPAVGDIGRSTVTAAATGAGSVATAAANNAATAQSSATTGGQASSIANLGSTAQATATGTGTATATATVANSVAIARAFGAGASASASATSIDPAGGATTVACTIPGGHAFAYTSDGGKTTMQFC